MVQMDMESYDTLYIRIKDSLIYPTDLNRKNLIASHFSLALIECNSCVSKALELATNQLEKTDFQVNQLCDYIENAVTLLQMLSDFIKNVLESAAMPCCNMKPFPTATGNIILTVFMHCKDSEWIYGHHLKFVETQLKDLFRTCHELQLTYLMTLEKHFIFDLTDKEEQDLLIEALNINMKIGEIVQALDIKTMAEQWKAYTVICEKYASFLLDKNIYNKCTQLFGHIIIDNIKTAMECKGDNKNIVRSLKVTNFTIKILSRFSNVFKHAVTNNYEHVVTLLEHIYLHNPAYLEFTANKPQQFINLVLTNILSPADVLCSILLQDERFLDYVYNIDVSALETKTFLGNTILIISIIKAVIEKKEDQVLNVAKRKLIDCIYRILPLGHYWFNTGLRFHSKSSGNDIYFGLYEHLLVHAVALATTFSSHHYTLLEKRMLKAVMTADCYSAMFSSNLWVLLMRMGNDHLASNTLSSLVTIYQKLEKNRAFHHSPQEVHLSNLIGKLFEISSYEDKRIMSKQIHPENAMWSVLKVSNLPDPLRKNIETAVLGTLKITVNELFESQGEKHMDSLIQIMKIAATCTFIESNDDIQQHVVLLWTKVCPKNGNEYIQSEDFGTAEAVWYFKYLEALAALTDCIVLKLNSTSLGKILHNISTLLYYCNTDIMLLLLDLFCKLAFIRNEDENQHVIDNIFKDTCRALLQGVDTLIKPYLLHILVKYKYNEQFYEITSTLFYEDESLRKECNLMCDDTNFVKSYQWQQDLMSAAHLEYTHKCRSTHANIIEKEHSIPRTKSNFDLGGFLFEDEIEEPSRKKAKLEIKDMEMLIESLEKNTSLLCEGHDTDLHLYRNRLVDVIEKLKNIVS